MLPPGPPLRAMKRFLLNDTNILVIILLNAVLIFLSGFHLPGHLKGTLNSLDLLFTLVFVVELVVKQRHYGLRRYFSESWNILDFILVVLALPSLAAAFRHPVSSGDLSYLLVFRTIRVFKLFRFFSFIDGINELLAGIRRGFRASVMILVTFIIFIFITSILSNNLFGKSELFKSPGTSLYTTFKVFTVEGWNEIPDALTEGETPLFVFLTRAYFVILLVTGGIFGLSFVNAVLVDAMVADNNDELEKKVDNLSTEIAALRKLLENKDGKP